MREEVFLNVIYLHNREIENMVVAQHFTCLYPSDISQALTLETITLFSAPIRTLLYISRNT